MDNYHYGFIGNCTSGALINTDTSIVWLCLPSFDSPSVFASLLDEKNGGFFQICPVDLVSSSQHYLDNTAILRTKIETSSGTFVLDDYMPKYKIEGLSDYCPAEIQRRIKVLTGTPRIRIRFSPMPNYALAPAHLELAPGYIKVMSQKGEYDSFYLYSDIDHNAILNNQPVELHNSSYLLFSYHEKICRPCKDKIYYDYQKTKTYWLDWSARTKVPGKYKKQMIRSAIILKLLTYQPTGAVLASLTTSLPEIIGENRNWDYRFCWIRDAAMMINVYMRLGHWSSAWKFMRFIIDRLPDKHESLKIMYSIRGTENLEEKILPHLEGYAGSKPVRIGNGAYVQKQNDVYGVLIQNLYTYFKSLRKRNPQTEEEIWTVVRAMVREAIKHWRDPDQGIWEKRNEAKNFVYSKLLNWVAIDRAIRIAHVINKTELIPLWEKERELIRKDILEKGWNDSIQSFTTYYGSSHCDASNLLMLHYGFLPPDDPRMTSTVETTYKRLVENGLCFRYREKDDFGCPENTFTVCTFWMINSLYLTGKKELARKMFENVIDKANHLGLLSEDIEPETGRQTGNFPQGYSHLAMIQTILLFETDYEWIDI